MWVLKIAEYNEFISCLYFGINELIYNETHLHKDGRKWVAHNEFGWGLPIKQYVEATGAHPILLKAIK